MSVDIRILRIERELRIWRAVAISFMAAVLLLAAETKRDELRVQKLIVGDEANGVVIAAEKGGASIYMSQISDASRSSVWIGAIDGGGEVVASGTSGTSTLRADKNDTGLELSANRDSTVSLTAGSSFQTVDITGGKDKLSLTPSSVDISGAKSSHIEMALVEGPSIRVSDANGFSAALGVVNLEDVKTGQKSTTSAASLRLFGRDSKTLWAAP